MQLFIFDNLALKLLIIAISESEAKIKLAKYVDNNDLPNSSEWICTHCWEIVKHDPLSLLCKGQ